MPNKFVSFSSSEAKIEAASDETSVRRFQMVAYTGVAMSQPWSDIPIVVDLSGMQISEKPRPILLEHDRARIIGHVDSAKNNGKTLVIAGPISAVSEDATRVVMSADNGFPWQASIGADIQASEFVKAGQKIKVNGRQFVGPILIARKTNLKEVSFVALGADDDTSAKMIASLKTHEENNMDFTQWLQANGWDESSLSDIQKKVLMASFEAETETAQPIVADDPVKQMRIAAAAEAGRIASIQKLCAGHPDVAQKAIEAEWNEDQIKMAVELAELKASRNSNAPMINGGSHAPVNAEVVEAAVCAALGMKDIEDSFDERTLEAAHKKFRGRIGLQEAVEVCARSNGYSGGSFKSNGRDMLRAAAGIQASGFSTIDIGGILSNVANKFMLQGFNFVEQSWRAVSSINPVNDFKTVTRYRLTGSGMYEKVGPGGEIKLGALAEESYTNAAETYGLRYAVSRNDLVNDDLGVLSQVPAKLGRGAALKLNDVFWTEFQADGNTFYTSGRGNYISGAGTALSMAALKTADATWSAKTDADGKPLGATARLLVVPPALRAAALELMRSTMVNSGGAASTAQIPSANIFADAYQVVTSQYLTGSATAWYLLADPMDIPVIETVFLNGVQVPTIETADVDFQNLGIQMRGYHDFGVNKADYRGALKAAGA